MNEWNQQKIKYDAPDHESLQWFWNRKREQKSTSVFPASQNSASGDPDKTPLSWMLNRNLEAYLDAKNAEKQLRIELQSRITAVFRSRAESLRAAEKAGLLRDSDSDYLSVSSLSPSLAGTEMRRDIRVICILDTQIDAPEEAADLSAEADGSVLCWTNNAVMTIAGNGCVRTNTSARFLFAHYCNLQEIHFCDHFSTARTRDFLGMFYGCQKLTVLNPGSWDVSRAQDMRCMFASCSALEVLDLSRWNISGVTDLTAMFRNCRHLSQIHIGHWDVSHVRHMDYLFDSCVRLTFLSVSHWNVSSVISMSAMFRKCRQLRTLQLPGWNVSGVTDFSSMFRDCMNLQKLNLQNWDVSRGIYLNRMFDSCTNLQDLDIRNWNPSRAKDLSFLFRSCVNLSDPNVANWNVSQAQNLTGMFRFCMSLASLDLTKWEVNENAVIDSIY